MKQFYQFSAMLIGTIVALVLLAPGSLRQSPALAMGTPVPDLTELLPADDTACDNTRTVQVSGAAAINVRPDRALIQLGVESTAATPKQVQADNNLAIEKITQAIGDLGIAEKHIATDYYVIQPVYHDYNSRRISHYRIDNILSITLTDISQASDVLIAALQAGANQVQNVQFYTSELRRYRDEARLLAMTAATEKAHALAGAGGGQADCLLQIHENSWSYYNGYWWGSSRDQAMWTQNVVQNAAPAEQATPDETPISVGQIVVRAEVNATFSLK